MGWWRIDPETGKTLADEPSKLSRPPDFVLLNAVPGVDDAVDAHYNGDGPGDMAWHAARLVVKLLGTDIRFSRDEALSLFLDRVVPPALLAVPAEQRTAALKIVDDLWPDVDDCYEFDWDRKAKPAERRWVCDDVLDALNHLGVLTKQEAAR